MAPLDLAMSGASGANYLTRRQAGPRGGTGAASAGSRLPTWVRPAPACERRRGTRVGPRRVGTSGRAETDEHRASDELSGLALGQPLYTAEDTEVGVEHARSGRAVGEADRVWRCSTCGEVDHIEDELPSTSPNCDAPREAVMDWTED